MFSRSDFDAFIRSLPYPPNDFQLKVHESIAFGRGNIVVSALAGSGKTSLLVQTAKLFAAMGISSVNYLAFNVSIKNELNERLPKPYSAINSHSLGMQVLKGVNPKTRVNTVKWAGIAKGVMSKIGVEPALQYAAGKVFQSLCSKVMLNMVDPTDLYRIGEIALQYGLDTATTPMMKAVEGAVQEAREIWERTGEINFDEMLYWPVVLNLQPPQFDYFLVDECQDLNILQQELAFRSVKPNGRMVFVGDKCQPEGTKVAVVRAEGNRFHHAQIEQVDIELLKVGDRVVSYTAGDCAFVQRGRAITGITKRPYSGRLTVVATEQGHVSRYTPNHHCFASFEPLRNKYVVYMMRRGNQFRIGKSRMAYISTKASGPVARARSEKADALWLLDCYDTESEALAMEGAISGRFGLPELIFQAIDGKIESQSVLDNAWDFIGDNLARAIDCLTYFGRDINYPLYDKTKHAHYLSFKRPMVVHACNLLDGALMLPYTNEAHTNKNNWLSIAITHEPYEGFVYSLSVEKEQLYVADGLVTHNCQAIYAFAGADAVSFQRIIEKTQATVLPLNMCYRCPTSHLDLARKIVPAIEARPGADAGVIEYVDETKIPDMAQEGSLVMCRLTAPLVSMYFKFIQRKISAKVMGKDIGSQLISIMDKVAKYEGYRYERSIEFLEKYREHQVMNLRQKEGTEQQIETVNDQVETLIVCITNFDSAKTLDMLKAVLEDLFGDQDKESWKKMVTLCTVHRAKGLESDDTFLLKPEKMPLIWKDQRPDEYEQELNILYVALTRSKKRMVIAGELSSVVKPLNQVVAKEVAQDDAEPLSAEVSLPLPLQPALLPIADPKPLPAPSPIKDFSAAVERFKNPIAITPVQVKPVEDRQRAAYSTAVLASLEQLSTGEIMQFMHVLQAILDERKEAI